MTTRTSRIEPPDRSKIPAIEPPVRGRSSRQPEIGLSEGTLPSSPMSISVDSAPSPRRKSAEGTGSDPLEHEADRVAHDVMEASPAGPSPSPAAPKLQRKLAASPGAESSPLAAAGLPSTVRDVVGSSGQPLDRGSRAFFEPRFGMDFGSVRVHTDPRAAGSARSLNARAYTFGSHIAFESGEYSPGTREGRELLAHELTHVVRQGARPTGVRAKGKPIAPPSPSLLFEMRLSAAGSSLNDTDARELLDIYQKMSPSDRETTFQRHYPNDFTKILRALPSDDAKGAYAQILIDVLRKVEEVETRKESGLTNDGIAQKKSADLKAVATADATKAIAAAAAAKKTPLKGLPAPTAAQIEKAKDAAVAKTSIDDSTHNRWTDLDKEKDPKKAKADWTKRGEAAIKKMVAHAAAKAPQLKLSESDFDLNFFGVDERGQGVLAMGGTKGGKRIAAVGFDFVTTVEVDPAYALSTVVHEISGHPQYGPYGTEYHLALYDSAAKKAGFKPKAAGSKARTKELDAYAYQETEIYSNMRELPFFTAVSAADEKKDPNLKDLNPDPAVLIAGHIKLIQDQWSGSGLDISMLRGIWSRYNLDPRIDPKALKAFKDGLKANKYTDDQIKEITK